MHQASHRLRLITTRLITLAAAVLAVRASAETVASLPVSTTTNPIATWGDYPNIGPGDFANGQEVCDRRRQIIHWLIPLVYSGTSIASGICVDSLGRQMGFPTCYWRCPVAFSFVSGTYTSPGTCNTPMPGCQSPRSCPTPSFRPDLPYALDSGGTTCSRADPCLSTNCDDGDACTDDSCAPAAGCAHAARNCDDGKACTEDRCEPDGGVCVNAVAVASCTCQGSAPPPLTAKPSKDIGLGTMACPAPDKGSLGATLKLSGEGTLESAWCGNDCRGKAGLGGTAALDLSVCGTTVTVSASGKYAVEKAHDKTCDAATCGTGCGAGYCETDEGSGSVSVGQSRFFGYDWSEKLAGGGKVFAKCGATLAGSVSVTGGLKEVTNHGAASCATCLSSNMALTGEAGATATCSYGISSPWGSKETGCLKCATVKTSVSGTANSQSGTCGSQACNALKGSVSAALTTPTVKLGLKWWTVEATCTATVDACRESNTCGTCTCGGAACSDFQPKMSCSVCAAGSLLAACRKS